MGLMRFINLAHGVFAMAGGYLVASLARRWDVDFFVALPLAFVFGAVARAWCSSACCTATSTDAARSTRCC